MAADTRAPTPRADHAPAFAVVTLQSVIQQLKDKEQDLQRLRQAAQDRACASENIAAVVLTNLDTGVVLFNAAGLAQQANPARGRSWVTPRFPACTRATFSAA